jgi:hypothetical protein
VVTSGNETDFDEIESDVRQLCSRFNVMSAGCDPWKSAQMSQRLRGEGVPMHEFRATTQNFSPAIIELDAAMRAGRLRYDGHLVLMWCISNVVGKADRHGNLYPTKSRERKIDAAVAVMIAIGSCDGGRRGGQRAGWFSRRSDIWVAIADRTRCRYFLTALRSAVRPFRQCCGAKPPSGGGGGRGQHPVKFVA